MWKWQSWMLVHTTNPNIEWAVNLNARQTSSTSQKARWFLDEQSLDYEFIATNGDTGELGTQTYHQDQA